MSTSEPDLLANARRLEQRILERVRGACITLASKVGLQFASIDAQPVVKIRSSSGRTVVGGSTPDAPMLLWGTGGFELSACIDKNDQALAIPLESDHATFYSSGKISDPATQRVHDRGLAVAIPFAFRKAAQAIAGELYLGHPGKKLHVKIDREGLRIELDVPGVSGQIVIGAGATRAAARVDDEVVGTLGFSAWANGVDAALVLAMSENAVPYTNTIGKVATGSATTVIR